MFRLARSREKGTLVLAKNPAGFNQALATLAAKDINPAATTLIVAINDLPLMA